MAERKKAAKRREKPKHKQERKAATNRLRIEHYPIDKLQPSAHNPRRIGPKEMAALERSISAFGIVDPVIARKQDRTVIGGHQRLLAARKLGLSVVPVVFVDLGEAEASALNIALNKISGTWELEQLGELLAELRELPAMDVTLTGFDTNEVEDLLAELEAQRPLAELGSDVARTDAAQTEVVSAPARVQVGQMWQLGEHRLLCGDSLETGTLSRLCEGQEVPLVLTDPPYGLDYQSRMTKPKTRKKSIANDEFDGFESSLERALPAVRQAMMSGGTLYWFSGSGGAKPVLALAMLAVARHFDLQNVLAWDKETPGLGWRWRPSWEAIIEATKGGRARWYGGTHRRNILRWPKLIPQADDHPTPKPTGLLAELIRVSSRPGDTVLDPFAGAGSSLIAAELTGRRCRAVELEPEYCDMILARWESLTGQQAEQMEDSDA